MVAVGNTDINEFYIGEEPVREIWNGSTLVWPEDPLLLSAIKIEIPESLRHTGYHWCTLEIITPYGGYEMQYQLSYDGITWHDLSRGVASHEFKFATDMYIQYEDEGIQYLYVRGYPTTTLPSSFESQRRIYFYSDTSDYQWLDLPVLDILGDVRSLIDYRDVEGTPIPKYAFQGLFQDDRYIGSCFGNANRLVLPMTTVPEGCFKDMFKGVISLRKGPESIVAESIGNHACENMFSGCTGMTQGVNYFPATTIGQFACMNMYSGCKSLKAGYTPNDATLPTGAYVGMFYNCSSLDSIRCLAKSISGNPEEPSNQALYEWVKGVDAQGNEGTLYVDKDTTLFYEGASTVPSGWRVVNYN